MAPLMLLFMYARATWVPSICTLKHWDSSKLQPTILVHIVPLSLLSLDAWELKKSIMQTEKMLWRCEKSSYKVVRHMLLLTAAAIKTIRSD